MNTSKSLDQILNELVTPWDTSDLPPNVRITSPSLKIDQAKAAIVEAVEGLIDREPESYRKYLVVRHKLGLEENQAQAKLIATVLDNYKAELLRAIKEWQHET